MQFVKGGPDIPERLLQAHEDERVVFFCGAGISYPAGLPGFAGLVCKIFRRAGVRPNAVQQAAIEAGQYDTAVGLLETDDVGGRRRIREPLHDILKPDPKVANPTATQESLLTLSRDREGRTRLITTNFDRLFEDVIESRGLEIETFQAPLLPIPKTQWDGLVYIHGVLNAHRTESNLNSLVLSSGDFGLAYLTERWAARFVTELLRNYTVCFIGYSIEDRVLRYMMDAHAADQEMGESRPEMFAFGPYVTGKDAEADNEWRTKKVTPILYCKDHGHGTLHDTLHAWAGIYRDGVRGKEQIVTEGARTGPQASTKEDLITTQAKRNLSSRSGIGGVLSAT